MQFARLRLCLAAGLIGIALAGCETDRGNLSLVASEPIDISPAPRAEPVNFTDVLPTETFRLGLLHFSRGEYGLSERYFRETVEKSPRNAEAWIGLAASYDRDRRFDLADRAYNVAIRLSGETTQILNNQGYSYMLRGDFRTARVKFLKAYRRDPHNTVIANNLRILDSRERANRHPPSR
jgi:Flp pilus assembly protein TadD